MMHNDASKTYAKVNALRWHRKQRSVYESACGNFKVWLGGDEAWYGEAFGVMSHPMSHKSVAQQWCNSQHKGK